MRRIWKRVTAGKCQHPHTIVITSVGVRRTVCHDCGHMSFKMTRKTATVPDREQPPQLDEAAGL